MVVQVIRSDVERGLKTGEESRVQEMSLSLGGSGLPGRNFERVPLEDSQTGIPSVRSSMLVAVGVDVLA